MRAPFAAFRRSLPALACASAVAMTAAAPAPNTQAKGDKPAISVKASPTVGFSPTRVVLTADLKGGANDFEEFYCATVEWDWGDDTRSESKADCDPYEIGKSEIRRRYTIDHVFDVSGAYRVEFRLKQKNKVVARGSADVKVRPGLREAAGGGPD